MGTSSDGIVGFGYAIDVDDSELEISNEWKDRFYDIEYKKEYSDIEFGIYCCDEYPMPFICLKRSYECVARGDVRKLELFKSFSEEEIQVLKNAVDELGMRMKDEEPYWFLVSYMG